VIKRLFKKIAFALADDSYNICIARNYKWLQDEVQNILTRSTKFLYICQCSGEPLLLRDEFRDMILTKLLTKEAGMDIKILIRESFFKSLSYYDTAFRTTENRIGNFVIGDGGDLVMATHEWNLFKVRYEYPGENLKSKFVSAYDAAGPTDKSIC
jgi:hypothetical protein